MCIRDREIEVHARDYGLDFFPILYEVLDYKTMNEVAAYGGFPTRYPHWRFGMDYEQLSKGYEFGLQKIYEMVINTNPAYAYLLEGNSLVDQKTVMAHVCGHVDFFKNNYYFSKTNRKMIDEMANHATRVRRHMERFGVERVEGFIDVCLSLDNLIDPMSMFIQRLSKGRPGKGDKEEAHPPGKLKLKAKSYMDRWGHAALAEDALRKAERELRSCTGSRLGTRCEEVYSMRMPKFWNVQPTGTVDQPASTGGYVSTGGGDSVGGPVLNTRYYQAVRWGLRDIEQYIMNNATNVQIGDLETVDN